MTLDQQEIYDEGYRAYNSGVDEESNPHQGLDAEFWSDGWVDAEEDEHNRTMRVNKRHDIAASRKK